MGAAALGIQHIALQNLCGAIDKDLREVGASLEHMKTSLVSLTELERSGLGVFEGRRSLCFPE